MMALPPPPRDLLNHASLFLDFDGTLCEFVAPDAHPSFEPGQRDLLRALWQRLDGRLAIVSGRSLDSLAAIIALDGIDLVGSHGVERRRADGRLVAPPAPPGLSQVHADARRVGELLDVIVEEKPTGAALHYRTNPSRAEAVHAEALTLAERHGLEVRPGSMVAEVRARGAHKGDAIRSLMGEAPFGGGIPLFVGDDLTDEDGFAAARALGGHGILVGAPRETSADFALPSVSATRIWLAA